jgi:hypothetical protein
MESPARARDFAKRFDASPGFRSGGERRGALLGRGRKRTALTMALQSIEVFTDRTQPLDQNYAVSRRVFQEEQTVGRNRALNRHCTM